MKPRIKYELKAYGRTVVFYVHEMDKRFLGCVFETKKGIGIRSFFTTMLSKKYIGLVGKSEDTGTDYISLDSEKETDEYIQGIHEAITDWANNWEGWGDSNEPEIEFVKSDGMYGCYSCRIAGSCDKNIKLMCNYSRNGYYVVKIGKKRTLTEDNGVFTI